MMANLTTLYPTLTFIKRKILLKLCLSDIKCLFFKSHEKLTVGYQTKLCTITTTV